MHSFKPFQDKLNTANHYSIELSTELKSLQLKYSKLQKQNSEFEKKESERTNLIKSIENEKVVLIKENADLKKRRELAMNEIKKLNEQISKKGPKSKGGPRNMSAAVIIINIQVVGSRQMSNGSKELTLEQEIILSSKKELDLVYKELIRAIFCDTKDSNVKNKIQRINQKP